MSTDDLLFISCHNARQWKFVDWNNWTLSFFPGPEKNKNIFRLDRLARETLKVVQTRAHWRPASGRRPTNGQIEFEENCYDQRARLRHLHTKVDIWTAEQLFDKISTISVGCDERIKSLSQSFGPRISDTVTWPSAGCRLQNPIKSTQWNFEFV